MSATQIFASGLLVLALVLFAWGRWRHDIIALTILMVGVLGGLVSPADAFLGFGHPAVVTVAAVLVFSRAMETTGVIAAIARLVGDQPSTPRQVALFCAIGALLSGFVNNVGALAMLMPLAIATARRHGKSPGGLLMPLSFATMLGGMTTLIGTPPNIIVSAYRADTLGTGYGLFDFMPAGAAVALLGLLFLATIGWRLIPRQRAETVQSFEGVDEYLAELHVADDSELIGQPAPAVGKALEQRGVEILGIVRDKEWTPAVSAWARIAADDVLLVEGAPDAVSKLQGWSGVSLGQPETPGQRTEPSDAIIAEVVLRPASLPVGSTPEELRMRSRYHVNLLGVSRQGARHFGALKAMRLQSGDVLLLQGKEADINDAIASFDALPLGDRNLSMPDRRAAIATVALFVAALAAIALGLTTPAVALTAGVVVLLLARVVPSRGLYHALDGAVIVVLGALLPVGQSLEASGVTQLIGDGLLAATVGQPAYLSLALVLLITMFVSDIINNAATAVIMAPVAYTVATGLGLGPDPFLMAVAIGASCAFLTPIGHQNNLLVLGPGGYRFGDYWRVGLPLEILIAGTATALLPVIWPFHPT